MAPRSVAGEAGQYAGVAFVSKLPCRTVATPWPPDLYETGRLQFGSFFTPMAWVTGSVLYGYPEGKTHPHAHAQTELMLDFAFQHLQQIPGPRFMCGDWNFCLDALAVTAQLRSVGWVEIQDLNHTHFGEPVKPTCKQVTRKDFLWISPELALSFRQLHHCDTTFADHAVLVAEFAGGPMHVEHFPWPCPKPVPWAQTPALPAVVPFCAPHDPTDQYAALWAQKEALAKTALQSEWLPSMGGRGQQTKPLRVVGRQAPLRQGKRHEVQPTFFGFSALHAKQFRQLRRLQNYCRWVDNKKHGTNDPVHGFGLWTSILKASGFSPSFSAWWHERTFVSPLDPVDIPCLCPPSDVAHQIYEAVLAEVRMFESRLNLAKAAYRRTQHEQDCTLVFREVAKSPAAPVETLIHSASALVLSVDVEECAVVLDQPMDFKQDHPVWIAGQLSSVIHADHDKLWLEDVDQISEGSKDNL